MQAVLPAQLLDGIKIAEAISKKYRNFYGRVYILSHFYARI